MESSALLDKIHQLEKELDLLKDQFSPKCKILKAFRRLKDAIDGIISYWVPLALLIAIGVNWWFGVGFFEDIKNIGINKTSSDYYFRIGDRLMRHAEFKAAAEAFTKSLAINSHNIDATRGLMKAQVLQPISTEGQFNPLVVEDKLNYLRDIFGKDDYILLYWEGILRRQQSATPSDLKVPESLFQRSIEENPEFPGSHLELGRTYLLEGELDKAVKKFHEVISLDKRFAIALSNLGYCQLVLANFEQDQATRKNILKKASDNLNSARRSEALPEIDLHLGDVYLLLKQYQPARISHENALESLEERSEKEDLSPSEVLLVFLPETTNEARERGPALVVSTVGEMKTLILYSLSLDYAVLGKFKNAERYFTDATALDTRRRFSPFIANKINSLLHLSSNTPRMRSWLTTHIKLVCKGMDGCRPEGMSRQENKEGDKY